MYLKIKNRFVLLFSLVALFAVTLVNAQPSAEQKKPKLSINKIISSSKVAAAQDRKANSARESRFKAEKNKQQGRLNAMVQERANQERISDRLDAAYTVNEGKIKVLTTELAKELGDLKELFGVIQQTASDAQENYKTSLISAQFPGRAENLRQMVAKMGSATELISIDEIDEMWYQLQNEMTQQGKIVKFNAPVSFVAGQEVDEDGKSYPIYEKEDRAVTRVGVYNAVSEDDILIYKNERGLTMLDRKMDSTFTSKSKDLQQASDGVTPFYIDPTRGGLLTALVKKPSLWEKIQEGKIVGYVIIFLGVIAMIIAIYKILMIRTVGAKVNRQAKNLKQLKLGNPLGRVLKVFHDNPKSDPESMELKLAEAILKETPKLNSWLMFVKIIAVVAPLLGLLGTVTGMIQTFQSITLYGAGDPQLMAGGISQALVTTVLGLVVAIPTVLLHSSAAGRAKEVEGVLEEHAAGLIAQQIEAQS